jgi:type I restriction enzyme S subunit
VSVGVIRNTNFTKEGTLDDSDIAYLDVEVKQFISRKLEFGDLILEKSGGGPKQPVGRVISFDKMVGNFSFSNFTSIIRIKDKAILDYSFLHKFLYYLYVTGATEKMQRQSTGIRNLQLKEYKLINVPLPPLPEQKHIVSILDQAFADLEQTRAKTEQNLKNARELFDSYLEQVFSQKGEGWVALPLGDICDFKHGFAFKSEFFVDKSKLVLLTPGSFYEDGGYRDRSEKTKYYEGDFPAEYLLNKGDLLVAMTEQAVGLLGSSALVPENGTFLHNQRLGLVELTPEFKNKVSLKFLFHLFNTKDFRAKVQETASGIKVRHTSPKKMKAISVPLLTDLEEQEVIAQKLFEAKEHVIELELIYKHKLTAINELKKSILQKAFSGELTAKAE